MFLYLNVLTTASARGISILTLKTEHNAAKLIIKHFNKSVTVVKHFYTIKMTTTWNAIPNLVVSNRTVNSFKKAWTKTWQKINHMSELTGITIIDAVHNSRELKQT